MSWSRAQVQQDRLIFRRHVWDRFVSAQQTWSCQTLMYEIAIDDVISGFSERGFPSGDQS